HLELGADDRIYVHLDAHSPVEGIKADGTCRYERAKATEHIRRDVIHAFTVSLRVDLGGRVSASGKELAAAEQAWRKARDSADPEAVAGPAVTLGALLEQQGHAARAQRLYRDAMATGHPEFGPAAAFSLAELLEARGDLDEAEGVYRWSIRSGHKEFAAWAVSGLA